MGCRIISEPVPCHHRKVGFGQSTPPFVIFFFFFLLQYWRLDPGCLEPDWLMPITGLHPREGLLLTYTTIIWIGKNYIYLLMYLYSYLDIHIYTLSQYCIGDGTQDWVHARLTPRSRIPRQGLLSVSPLLGVWVVGCRWGRTVVVSPPCG